MYKTMSGAKEIRNQKEKHVPESTISTGRRGGERERERERERGKPILTRKE